MQRLGASVVLLDGWRRALLAVLAGAVTTFGLAPFNLPLAAFAGFPLLVWMLDGAAGHPGRGLLRRLAPAFGIGWLFGFGYFAAGIWWLGTAMLVEAENFLWAVPFAVLVLPAILAVYFGLAAALARAVWSDGVGRLMALAASLTLFEVLRGVLFTGFPWNEIGVIAAPVPLLMQTVSLVGLHGLTLGAVFVFSAPALLADPRPRRVGLALALVLGIAHVGFGAVRLLGADPAADETVRLRIVQPNILQSEKWDAAEADRIFERLVTLTGLRNDALTGAPPASPGPSALRTLVIWPESAFPFLLTQRPDAIARLADALSPGQTLIAGAARMEAASGGSAPRYYNSIYVINDGGEIIDARDKVHLVPFGEYLPFQDALEGWGVRQLAQLPGGFSPGTERRVVELDGAPPFLPLICYEVIFQDEIEGGEEPRPGFILNVTNDAWYGRTPGPYQHLRQAELTAVALGLPLIRSANTGVSVVNNAYGQTIEGLSLGSSGVIDRSLPQPAPATLFYAYRNVPFWCLFTITCLIACGLWIRDARRD